MAKLIPVTLLVAFLVWPLLAEAKWTEASSRHFVIYSEASPEVVRKVGEKLERYDQALRHLHGLGDPELGPANRLTIYVLDTPDDVRRVLRKDHRIDHSSSFYSRRGGNPVVLTFDPNSGSENECFNGQIVLFHAYAHHFLYSNYRLALPDWLSEGYAEFYSTAKVLRNDTVRMGLSAVYLEQNLRDVFPLSLNAMLSMTMDNPRSTERSLLLSHVWLLTHHLIMQPNRRGELQAYIGELGRGKNSIEAANVAFGDLAKLDRDIVHYRRRGRLASVDVPVDVMKLGTVSTRAVSSDEEAVMLLRIRPKLGIDAQQASILVPEMRRAVAAFTDSAVAQMALAEAEFAAGNLREAETAADRALASNPQAIDAHVYKGRALLAAAQTDANHDPAIWRNVRHWFIAANRLDPANPEPLALFYLSFIANGEAPTVNATAGLNRAYELAPQDQRLRGLVAYQYLVDGQTAEARSALLLLATDQQGGNAASAAGILEKLDRLGTDAALAAFEASDTLSW